MAKILLIQPPIRDYYRTAKRTIPQGLAAIAGSLRTEGFDVEIFDALATDRRKTLDPPEEMAYLSPFYGTPDISPMALFHRFSHFGYSYEHIENVVRRADAFLVGISALFTAYAEEALETARVVKRASPNAWVVMGGHHATAFPEAVLSSGAVDVVIRGEGEAAMTALATALRRNDPVEEIPGIALRTPSGGYVAHPPAVIADLDRLPPPALDLIRHDYYRRAKRGCAVVTASRGCPMACAYCCMGKHAPFPYRRRDPGSVLAEIETAVRDHDAAFIDFEDENLTLDRYGCMRLLQGIRERFSGMGLELRAMNGLYPPSLDIDLLKAMRAAGFTALNLSLGTTDARQLERFRRPDVRKSFETVATAGSRLGFSMVAYILIAAPGQDPMASVADLLYLSRMPVIAGLSVFYPAPFSPMYDTCDRLGLLPTKTGCYRSTAFPISDTTTRLQAVTLMRLGRMVNFMKRMKAAGMAIPVPGTFKETENMPKSMADASALEKGQRLLTAFFRDGQIRGLSPEGKTYVHPTDPSIITRFLSDFSPDLLVQA